MEAIVEVKLPLMGEGIQSGDVVRVLVKAGDRVQAEQPIAELETAKAVVEVPSPLAGVVEQILIREGDVIPVGAVMLTLRVEQAAPAPAAAPSISLPPHAASQPAPLPPPTTSAHEPSPPLVPSPTTAAQPPPSVEGEVLPAGPSARRLARELGVDLRLIPGHGPAGRIEPGDVKDYVQETMQRHSERTLREHIMEFGAAPDFSQWGPVERRKLTNVRRTIVEHTSMIWHTIPQVTQFERADITELDQLRRRFSAEVEARTGGEARLTLTVPLLRIVVAALKQCPEFNASLDLAAGELVFKQYYHIGIATDTPRGLLVPVLRDVERKALPELARELAALTRRAREGKIELGELRGGSFTISNQGGIGGAEFSPLVNYPEVAILGVGRARIEPAYLPRLSSDELGQATPQPRLLLPLALSYDHRVVDGAQAARFIRLIKDALEEPERLLLGL